MENNNNFNVDIFPLLELGGLNPLIDDYIKQEPKLRELFSFEPNLEAIDDVIQQKSCEIIDRKVLMELINDQYDNLKIPASVQENISRLPEPTTFCIVTAHQPCIFSGPLYFIYKILSAIKMAKTCNERFKEYHFIPVFWIGGEDHDFEEINHIHMFGKTLSWNSAQEGAVGRMKLDGISPLIEEIEELVGRLPHASVVLDLVKNAYKEEHTLTQATRIFINDLFGELGVVVIDQDSKELKKHLIPIIEREILEMSSHEVIQSEIDFLSKEYKVQAHPREINMFYLGDGFRRRIVKKHDRFEVLDSDISFNEEEIVKHIREYPERFSPNVILRPLYQQLVLPAVAYVGGPGELAYWLQLKKVFLNNQVCFPMLMLRDNVLIVDSRSHQQIKDLGFDLKQLFRDTDQLIRDFVDRHSESVGFDKEKMDIKNIFDQVQQRVVSIDKTLEKSVESEYRKIERSLENLETKVERAQKRSHETSVNKIERLKSKFFPENNWQERHDNVLIYLALYGQDLIHTLVNSFDPFRNEMKVISETDQSV